MKRKLHLSILLALFIIGCSCARKPQPVIPPETPQETPNAPAPSDQTPAPAPTPAPTPPASRVQGDVLARIGRKEITREEFRRNYETYLLIVDPQKEKVLSRNDYFNKMITDELVRRFAENEKIDRDPIFIAQLEKEKQQILLDHILKNVLLEKIAVTEDEAAGYYRANPDEFTQPARIQVRHILLGTVEDARRALFRLEAGEDFGSVAREMSIHASRNQGGQIAPFERGTYNKDFEDVAFPLKVGERSGIVKTDLGYHIIEKTDESPATLIPFADVKEAIMNKMMREKRERAFETLYNKIRQEIPVQIINRP